MRRSRFAGIALGLACLLAGPLAGASGPRWVTGEPYYYPPGNPVVWYIDRPSYFTDPGDLSPYVDNAAANALVAAAAGVWTIPTSRLVLSYGGALAEHVSSANVSVSSSGLVFPADVQSTNYAAIPIAVLYDSDGSITDLMLGSGASNPVNCRNAGVTESVDWIAGDGKILHAILVLNGRCTGPAPEQLQLQYQLMRAFGRVLGIGWSQTNDNVFTGSPTPNYDQALNWPIMHPIDIICGPYTYQCLPQPFSLRPDDTASLGLLYTVWPPFTPPAPGKTDTLARANRLQGHVTFPNGQGMQGVNVVVHRLEPFWSIPEDWETASGVTGFLFRRDAGGPVTGPPAASVMNMGTTDPQWEGYYDILGIPLQDWEVWQNLVITTQPINPLYIGPYAVGPYDASSVAPSGTPPQEEAYVMGTYADLTLDFSIPDAAGSCNTSTDGTEVAPAVTNAQGWWTGTLCGYGHSAWSSLALKAQRTATLEVTALDEQGYATSSKAMPVSGLWNATDATGTLPTVASAASAFNGTSTGMTSLTIASASQAQQLRMVIADQRGDGRPDFAYQARLLYADAITPATVPASGGLVTITGSGFRAGDVVTINGVGASVSSWTSTAITAVVPSLHNLHSTSALTADVVVTDPETGGATTMSAALAYVAQPSLTLISAPSDAVFTGIAAPTEFTVQALASDGVTPIAGQAVTFSSTAGQVQFNACGGTSCVVLTDISGKAATTVTALSAGAVTLSASSAVGTQTVSFTALARQQSITALNPVEYIAAGAEVSWTPVVTLADNAAPTDGLTVQWQGAAGAVVNPAITMSDTASSSQTTVLAGPLASGITATIGACAWTSICTAFSVVGVDPSQWQLQIVSGGTQSLRSADTFGPVVLRVTDAASHPVAGAVVQIEQTLEPWGPPCPDHGRCPVAPVYGSLASTLTSDMNGLVTVTPLEAQGQAEVTNIAVATGTEGFVSFTVQKEP